MDTSTMETNIPFARVPVSPAPVPTDQCRQHRNQKPVMESNGKPAHAEVASSSPLPASPATAPALPGSRVLLYKEDPSVTEIGIRKVSFPSFISNGPQDLLFKSTGLPTVNKNAFDDFIQTPGTDAFDSVQAFSVARLTLTMVQRSLAVNGLSSVIPWQWNSAGNMEPTQVYAHSLPDVMNVHYSRPEKCLKLGDLVAPCTNNRIFTGRSLNMVAHSTGHAILAAPDPVATYARVVNQILNKCISDGKPIQYRAFIRNRFIFQEVVVSPQTLTTASTEATELMAYEHESLHAIMGQDRSTCCGTMKHEEYYDISAYLQKEERELMEAARNMKQ